MRYPHVVLDLNGTLVDAFDDLTASLNAILVAHGRMALQVAQVRQWSGEGLRALLHKAFRTTGPTPSDLEIGEILRHFRVVYAEHLGSRATLYPGVAAALDTLGRQGVRMSILTNKPQSPSLKLLERMGIGQHFEYMVAGDGDLPRKPDPTGLLQLVTWMDADADSTLMVGSSRIDLETARNAGVRCALVDHERGSLYARGLGADFVLETMGNLVPLVLGRQPSGVVRL